MPLYSHSTIIPLNNPFQGWNAKVITVTIHQKYIEHKKVIVEVFISWGVIQKLEKVTYAKTFKLNIKDKLCLLFKYLHRRNATRNGFYFICEGAEKCKISLSLCEFSLRVFRHGPGSPDSTGGWDPNFEKCCCCHYCGYLSLGRLGGVAASASPTRGFNGPLILCH